jgi:hypothetical protein
MTIDLSTAKLEVVQPRNGRPYTVVEVPSDSNPSVKYRVDLVNARCSCPAWKFGRGKTGGVCKHLIALGFRAK